MTSLSDFNTPVEKPKLSDFFASSKTPSPFLNQASINSVAASTASITPPDQMEGVYNRVTDDLNYGLSDRVNQVLDDYDNKNQQADYQSLVSIVSDPSLSPDQRANAIKNFNAPGSDRIARTFAQRTSLAAAMADSESTDNDETEFVRLDTTKALNQVDEYNGWVQQQINQIDNLSNPNILSSIKNVVELITPFINQTETARVGAQFLNEDGSINAGAIGEALTLMGNDKARIRDTIRSMPIDQRRAVAENLMEIVTGGNGNVVRSPNDLLMMDQLNSFLVSGTYGDDEQLVDNIASLLDLTLVGGPFVRLLKGVGKAARGLKGAAVEAATMQRYERAMKALNEPEVAQGIDDVLDQAVPNTRVDDVIDRLTALDNSPSAGIAQARSVLEKHLNSADDVSVDQIIGEIEALDNVPSDQIAQARQVIGEAAGARNKELEMMVNDETIQGTRDLVSNKIIDTLTTLDEAPSNVYREIRDVVDKNIDVMSIGQRGLSQKLIDDVNNILLNHGLRETKGKEAGQLKSFITNSTQESNIRRRYIRTTVNPLSVSQSYKDFNPGKARIAHQMIVRDKTGNAANILYGTNRTEAVANDVLPEVNTEINSVRNKVAIDEAFPTPDKKLIDELREARGDIQYKPEEKIARRNLAKDDWRDIQGLYPRKEMSTIGDNDRGVSFDVVYGPKDGGFSEPSQAIEQAQFALRKYGVNSSDIEVLGKNVQGEYVPVTDFSKKGDYLIRVKHNYEFSPADAVGWGITSSDKFLRMFDAITPLTAGKAGGLFQHLIPSTSVVDETLLNAASVAADRSSWIMKRLLELGNEYAKKYKALNSTQQRIVDDYIVRANAKGLKFNSVFLKSIGLNDKAIEALRSWKTVQDTLYHFENLDLNKSLRARGWQRFVDNANDTDIVVKPMHINQTGDVTRAFDGNEIVKLSRKDIQLIYERGGNIARTRGAIEFEDDAFEYVIVSNHSSGSYTRAIRDDDTILNYRDGYYSVKYNQPYFITKEVKAKDGSVYIKAIATAENRNLADAALARLRATDEKGVYGLRGDLKRGSDAFAESEWEATVARGRSAQRIRGERLKNFGETEDDINKLNIESPEESLINSIRSLSNRVSHRDFIDSAKTRFTNQFKDLMPVEKGQVRWPNDIRELGKGNLEVSKSRLADARSTWRYIEAIDSGYVNLIDDVSKNFFKNFSDISGRMGWGWLEKGGRLAEKVGPTGWARKKAFRLLLAANPLRQLPVQAMQALPVVLATNPTMVLSGRLASQFILLNYAARGGDVDSFFKAIARNLTGLTAKEAKTLVKNFELSGFEASVQANTLIRDDMKSVVNKTFFQKARSVTSAPLNFLQKIGFEAGENMLMRTVWLSEYDNLRKAKKGAEITMEDIENLNAKVRHLTLNMNKAGELPYNENALSAALQFFQAPHKAFAQIVLGHKGLTTSERTRLGAAYVLAFGLGGGPVTSLLSNIIPDSNDNLLIETLEGGLFNILMNKTLSSVYGQDVGVDFSDSFRLLQLPNFFQFFKDLMGLQVGEMLTASPSASLVFGDNPRVTEFVKQLSRPFVVDNSKRPEEMMTTGVEFLNMFSGASNFFKAKYILEHGKSISSSGATIDPKVNYVEAMLRAGGFSTMDEVKYYALNDKTYNASQKYKDDIHHLITETSKRLALEGISNDQAEYYVDMLAEAQRVYGNNPFYLEAFQNELDYKAGQDDFTLFNTLMRLAQYTSPQDMEDMLRNAPSQLTPDQIDTIRGAIRIINESE